MAKIFIQNLKVFGILGIHAHEQRKKQEIRVSVEIKTDIKEAAKGDDVNKTIDYSGLSDDIIQFIDDSNYGTIEALITALADRILENEKINSVWLKIEKPNAVPQADSVGVEIKRSK
ncbi:MAG TPA: dihydroneopterin aldolase [Anaerolineaceae bacterium]|jgi:dihydroneopterin aldolase|nr:MAG: dihydroneopterin aldolase [Anaerolineaceae bacterium 46_22]HAF48451.1 dihydroneopterin aldolase [Anaerolineaceae bacterium]